MLTAIPESLRLIRLLTIFFAAFTAAAAIAQDSVEFTDLVELAATVSAIDREQRLVTLRGPDGGELTIQAGPEVRNFAQIEAGDIVRLSYEQYYSATRIDPAEAPQLAAAGAAGLARAEEGERPGVAVGAIETMLVMIESIGPGGRTATFITSDGALQAIFVRREESRAFASSLQPGDIVQLTVAEAVALLVDPLED